jgi:peptidoglycan/xylan/chitin deacetylase (PgdA/CDA1 family)
MSNINIPILMYHSVELMPRSTIMRSLHVPPNRFRLQMWLLNFLGYKGLSMKHLKPYLDGKKQGKVVGITFDDGYQNNLINAAPILKKYNFSATCYIVNKRIGTSNKWDLEHHITQRSLMNDSEVREWLKMGMDIGAHSQTHPNLNECTLRELDDEISKCRSELESKFLTTVTDFCYPYGKYNDLVVQFTKKSGYKTATTMNRGRAKFNSDHLRLPRIPITHHTLLHLFLAKILSKYEDKR